MPTRNAPSQIVQHLGEIRVAGPESAFFPTLHRWIVGPLRGCTAGAIREARTVLDELVANAFQHGSPPFTVRLLITGDSRTVRLEVDDGGVSASSGWRLRRGLHLVRGLCDSWGVEHRDVGKTVWAEFPVLVPPRGS